LHNAKIRGIIPVERREVDMGNMIIGNRIEQRRKSLGLTLDDVAQEIGLAKSTVQRYEKGTIETIKLPVIEAIARILKVNPAWICGKTDSMELEEKAISLPPNIIPLPKMKKVPLVGQIACGTPILAEQNIEEYIDIPSHITADYALTCKGESMINIGINTGDIVYIRHQEEVENGQVAAVMVGEDEATLKRFYHNRDVIQLVAENSAIAPLVFIGEDIKEVHVVGRAVAYTHIIE